MAHQRRTTGDSQPLDPEAIDAAYGLEPVFEPGSRDDDAHGAHDTRFMSVECPYCGECFDTQADPTGGSACYVEDCAVCCQPIEMSLEVDEDGAVRRLTAHRGD